MNSRKFVLLAILAALIAGVVPLAWSVPTGEPSGKIAPRVLAETLNGGSSEALVVLTQQADLSAAASFSTKLEKGYFVVNTLRAVAGRTQGPILSLLQQRGVP